MENFVVPVIKADLTLIDNYTPDESEAPIDIGLTVIRGTKDTAILKEAQTAWARRVSTPDKMTYLEVEDDHFFLKRTKDNGTGSLLVKEIEKLEAISAALSGRPR